MQITETPIGGLLIIQPEVYEDERGYFFESYNYNLFKRYGLPTEFLQDNQSLSQKNVVRGLHFQNPPYAQGKLVSVIRGSVLDVVVDLRKNSLTFGKYYTVELSDKNKSILWIPPGFAHGFKALEDNTLFFYKCTALYNKESESGIRWDDPSIGINWQVKQPIISPKDLELPVMEESNILF